MRLKEGMILPLIVLSLGFMGGVSLAQGNEPPSSIEGMDFAAIKRDLAVFQGVVDTTVKQTVQGFMPLLGSTRGVLLPEYGVVFSLEVNLYQIRFLSPFNMRPHSQQELDDAYQQLLARLESIKQNLVKVIGEHGSALGQLKPQDYLTIVVYLLPIDVGPNRSIPTQVIMRVKRSFVNDYRESRLTFSGFSKKMETVQF